MVLMKASNFCTIALETRFQFAHQILISVRNKKSFRLNHIYFFLQVTMEEGSFDISEQ